MLFLYFSLFTFAFLPLPIRVVAGSDLCKSMAAEIACFQMQTNAIIHSLVPFPYRHIGQFPICGPFSGYQTETLVRRMADCPAPDPA